MDKSTARKIRIVSWVLFIIYMLLLAYMLLWAESYGRTDDFVGYRYNLVPLREIRRFYENREVLGRWAVFLNIYGNIIGFIPFGAILPVISRWARSFIRTTIAGCLVSCVIELCQLFFKRGSCDIDDVLLNTLGVIAGYMIFAAANHYRLTRMG